jgi:hypothetical protein
MTLKVLTLFQPVFLAHNQRIVVALSHKHLHASEQALNNSLTFCVQEATLCVGVITKSDINPLFCAKKDE